MALEQYFFSVSLRAFMVRSFRILAFSLIHQFIDLPVNDVSAARHPEKNEKSDEYAPGTEPLVDGPTDEKAEGDASGHGQANLHHNGHIFSPVPIVTVFEKLLSSRFLPPVRPPMVISLFVFIANQGNRKGIFEE